jgi:aspartate racemase
MPRNLEQAGTQLLLIACNAAHYYHGRIADSVSVPVLHIMGETATYCQRRFPLIKSFGLLAGSSTIELGLYPKAFERIQKQVLTPKPEEQEKVLHSI